jgi:sec-independent protein translocase protein TatA
MSIGHWEIVLAVLVIIIFFGGKKIPELARGIGKGLAEFKKTRKKITDEVNSVVEDVDNINK